MKLLQENEGFSPISIVLETMEEAQVFWSMLDRVKKTTEKDAEHKMAKTIANWIYIDVKF